MNWTAEVENRFSELRQKELTGILTKVEKTELTELVLAIEAEEAQQLAGTFARVRAEQIVTRTEIQATQDDNNQLVRIVAQQEQLIVDAQRWLAEFERRHKMIRQSYTLLTGEALA